MMVRMDEHFDEATKMKMTAKNRRCSQSDPVGLFSNFEQALLLFYLFNSNEYETQMCEINLVLGTIE